MHQAQSYILTNILPAYPGTPPGSIALDSIFASAIEQRLKSDALGYCYSGMISIADAAKEINTGFFTWATVKLYYATFYLIRSLLAFKGIGIFYFKKSPYRWLAVAGQTPKKLKGTTHSVVLNEFEAHAVHPKFLSQQISGISPLHWLRERREEANYGKARFEEPVAPDHLKLISSYGVRNAIESYVSDNTQLYVFDPDHAVLAYPIELLKETLTEIAGLPDTYLLPTQDRTYLASLYRDAKGPFPRMVRLVNG